MAARRFLSPHYLLNPTHQAVHLVTQRIEDDDNDEKLMVLMMTTNVSYGVNVTTCLSTSKTLQL